MNLISRLGLVVLMGLSNPAFALDTQALYNQANAAYEAKDYEKALSQMTSLAVTGDMQAQHYVGYMHAYGKGTLKDYQEASRWYCRAALQGNAKSMANIGRMYVNGAGVEPNPQTANWWYQHAAQLGDPIAQVNLGMNHLDGEGTAEDATKAYTWLSIALGDSPTGNSLASEYLNDAQKALSPDQRRSLTDQVTRWQPKPFSKHLQSEIQKSELCKAQDLDMNALAFNTAVKAFNGEDYTLADAILNPLAEAGHVSSQIYVARMYDEGLGRVRDQAQAIAWYCRAATLGALEALDWLVQANQNDTDTVLLLEHISADLGDDRAQLSLGRHYMSNDLVQAYKWLSVATNENLGESGEAEELFDEVRAQVTQEQKIAGIMMAADFWPVSFNDKMAMTIQTSKACSAK
ncbi:MAG: sel1 repeat family protein [Magnetovibrio sp.]|nr:sel1 repeat family protein [Magnetovibrio sp.]